DKVTFFIHAKQHPFFSAQACFTDIFFSSPARFTMDGLFFLEWSIIQQGRTENKRQYSYDGQWEENRKEQFRNEEFIIVKSKLGIILYNPQEIYKEISNH